MRSAHDAQHMMTSLSIHLARGQILLRERKGLATLWFFYIYCLNYQLQESVDYYKCVRIMEILAEIILG